MRGMMSLLAIATVALLAWCGAAAAPGGWWIGVPSAAEITIVGAGAVALAFWQRGRTLPVVAPLFAIVGLLLSGLPLPGLEALSGPPLLAFALAGIVLCTWNDGLRSVSVLFFPLVLTVYLGVALGAQRQVGAEGDEPHYLMVAESLLRDGDLSLGPDYAEGRYRAFYKTRPILDPHYRVRGERGEIFSLHALGLSLLILPAYALAGYPGASLFMALLAAVLAWEIRELLRGLARDSVSAEATAWVVALSPPLIHYAGLVFTEVPAALVVAFALRKGHRGESVADAVAVGAALACLPWLNARYAPLSVVLALYACSAHGWRWRRVGALSTPGVVSALGLLAYHHALYGFWDPRRVYGRRPEFSLAALPEGLQGLFLDQEFGLLVYAPVFVLALAGAARLWRGDRRMAWAIAAVVSITSVTAGSWHMWRGGFNPPARFLVPVVPALAPAVAAGLSAGPTPGAALLVGWSLWTGAAGANDPRLVHRDRDGAAPLFREHSGAREWTSLLPGYVLSESDRYRLAAIWGVVLLVAVLPWPRRFGTLAPGWALALGWVTVCLAAGLAGVVGDRHAGGRDAVRLIGRRALRVPGWTVSIADARWGPNVLDWGPLFEPHRHPDGAIIGSRLSLPAGRYTLRVSGEAFGSTPAVLSIGDHTGRRMSVALETGPNELSASFDLDRKRVVTLALTGGSPLWLEEVGLSRSGEPQGDIFSAYNRDSGLPSG
jgi:hypothetical protein